jgi:hypothetical protein
MSADVLQFRQRPVKGLVRKTGPGALYQCTTCKGPQFHINTEGEVWCVVCERVIANLRVLAK